MIIQPSKRCSKCDTVKPLTEFSKHRGRADGFQAHCKTCVKATFDRWYARPEHAARVVASARQWFVENTEHARELRKALYHRSEEKRERIARWPKMHPAERRAIHANSRARILGAPGAGVDAEDIAELLSCSAGLCMYCGRHRTLCLDHIDPMSNGGVHESANLAPCCRACNSSKRDDSLIVWLAKRRSGLRRDRRVAA